MEVAYKETAQKVLGYKNKGQKPWIGKESWNLVEERRKLKSNCEQAKSNRTFKMITGTRTRKSRET